MGLALHRRGRQTMIRARGAGRGGQGYAKQRRASVLSDFTQQRSRRCYRKQCMRHRGARGTLKPQSLGFNDSRRKTTPAVRSPLASTPSQTVGCKLETPIRGPQATSWGLPQITHLHNVRVSQDNLPKKTAENAVGCVRGLGQNPNECLPTYDFLGKVWG